MQVQQSMYHLHVPLSGLLLQQVVLYRQVLQLLMLIRSLFQHGLPATIQTWLQKLSLLSMLLLVEYTLLLFLLQIVEKAVLLALKLFKLMEAHGIMQELHVLIVLSNHALVLTSTLQLKGRYLVLL